MMLSIVTTLFNSSKCIEEFYRRITGTVQKITEDYEIIFVNDGSEDDSLEKTVALFRKDNRVKIIDLSRNFGHHRAIMTGLMYTTGDYVFLIDSDLEEEPELLEDFWDELSSLKDVDVVYGVQKRRKGKIFERITGWLFYKLFNLVSDHKISKNVSLVRLMTRRYVDNLIRHKESHPVFAGLGVLTGFVQKELIINKKSKGRSAYSFRLKVSLLVNSITSFSAKPLVFIFYLGLFILLTAFILGIRILYRKLFYGVAMGYSSIVMSIWFLGGLITFCVGLIGIYLEKVFMQTKNRPYSIIRKIYSRKGDLNK
jgi:putative glycosyltransferase